MSDRYTYRVTWSVEDEEYVGLCLEFPLLSWLAPRPEDAFAGIRRTVADAVQDMQSAGEAVPEPLATRPYSGRILLRVPPEIHRELATQATEEGRKPEPTAKRTPVVSATEPASRGRATTRGNPCEVANRRHHASGL